MSIFVDTSAFLAILDADDAEHPRAKSTWEYLITHDEVMTCSNYVLVETFALVQHRLGMAAVRAFQADVYPLLNIEWVDEVTHRAGVAAVLAASRRRLSGSLVIPEIHNSMIFMANNECPYKSSWIL
jgi:predicted nucleic acid-binding protein